MTYIVLNKWQMKNKELVDSFKRMGWKVIKNKKVPLSSFKGITKP